MTVIISFCFDDNIKSDIYAMYEMKKYGFTATSAVVTSTIQWGQGTYDSIDDLNTLIRNGWEIASKTVDNLDLTLPTTQLANELNNSKQFLVGYGITPTTLIYPLGQYNSNIINTASAYYSLARTMNCSPIDRTISPVNPMTLNGCKITAVEQVISSIESALAITTTTRPIWLSYIFNQLKDYKDFSIQVQSNATVGIEETYSTSHRTFLKILEIIRSYNINVYSLKAAYNLYQTM